MSWTGRLNLPAIDMRPALVLLHEHKEGLRGNGGVAPRFLSARRRDPTRSFADRLCWHDPQPGAIRPPDEDVACVLQGHLGVRRVDRPDVLKGDIKPILLEDLKARPLRIVHP